MKILLACLAIQVLLSAQAYGESRSCGDGEAGVSGDAPAATAPEVPGQQSAGGCEEGRDDDREVAIIEADCLKEGKPCNIFTNRCCPGYSCQGGLAATCVRKQ